MDRASEYFRRAATQTDSPRARAVVNDREFSCEAIRSFYAPYALPGKGRPPRRFVRMA